MMKSTRFTLPLTAVIILLAGTAYAAAPMTPGALVAGSNGQAAPMGGGKPAPTPPPKPIGPPKSGDE